MKAANNNNRMGHIDSIRGIAALLVAFMHICQNYIHIPATYIDPAVKANGIFLYDIAYQLDFGKAGVIAFFAISGFVICPTLKGGRYDGTRKFLISRFFRLFPAFWISILLVLLTRYVWYGQTIGMPRILGNIPMLHSVFQVKPLQDLYWTLEVELIFYFLCLALFLCGRLHKPLFLFFVGLVLMAAYHWLAGRPDIRSEITNALSSSWVLMPWHLAIMFWGGLFRIWYDDREQMFFLGSFRIPVVSLVAALLLAILWRPLALTCNWVIQADFGAVRQMAAYFLGLGLFILGALYIKLNNRFLVWLGTISYSLYLLHTVAFSIVVAVIQTDPPQWRNLHLGVYLLACISLSILLAGFVYYCIEKPAIRFGRYLQNR